MLAQPGDRPGSWIATREHVAEALGVSARTVRRWERGTVAEAPRVYRVALLGLAVLGARYWGTAGWRERVAGWLELQL